MAAAMDGSMVQMDGVRSTLYWLYRYFALILFYFETINVRAIDACTWLQGKASSARAQPNYVGIGNSFNQTISKDVDRTDNNRDGLGPW
jgi:hypothetical protein